MWTATDGCLDEGASGSVTAFRPQDKIDRLGAEALGEALSRSAPRRPEDAAALVRVLESLEPLSEDSARRPSRGLATAAAFWD